MTSLPLQALSEGIAGEFDSLIDDIVAAIFERNPTRFLKAHYVPVEGTEQAFVRFEFDWSLFDLTFNTELRSALRAKGFELPWRESHLAVAPNRAPALTTESESERK